MNRSPHLQKYLNWSYAFHEKSSSLMLVLIGIAFLVSDFRYNGFTFADFLLMFVMFILLVSAQIQINKIQKIIVIGVLTILSVNVILTFYLNPDVMINLLITQSIKLIFYLGTTIVLYNYITKYKLKRSFLTVNKTLALLSILVGIYITLAIYSDGMLAYESLWQFTRSHPTSYEFQGNPNIIRTRSLFSEPAHFGFYLNVILASVLFNVQHYKKKIVEVIILITGIIITLSYSMVGIMLTLISYYLVKQIKDTKVQWTRCHTITFVLTVLLLILFWDNVYITLIDRTLNILSGNDSSAMNRLFNSWQYVTDQSVIYGNGISHTPTITNNFAYILSDFGLIGFIPFSLFTIYLMYTNLPFGLTFVMLNFARGGYLAAPFWIVLLFYFLYSFKGNNRKSKFLMRR